jgi:DNA repair protein SbcD/Mre11
VSSSPDPSIVPAPRLKFIHCSDLHLDSPLDGLERYDGAPLDDLRGATRQALRNLVRLAIEREVDFVVIAGDVYDGDWRDMNTGLFFHACLAELGRAGIAVYVKRGNHDAASEITRSLPLPANVHEFPSRSAQTFRIEHLKVAVHGRSFPERLVSEEFVAGYPEPVPGWFNVGVLHTSLGGYTGHASYAPTSLETLRGKGYDYWALGHVHNREVLSAERPRIVYCGNLQGRHAAETGPKGCELVTVDGDRLEAEFVPLDVVRWQQVALSIDGLVAETEFWTRTDAQLQALHRESGGRLSALRVAIEGSGPLHAALAARPDDFAMRLRALATDCCGGRAWIEKIRFRTMPAWEAAGMRERDDPIGECLRVAAEKLGDPAALAAFCGGSLQDLAGKLPAELRVGAEALGLDDPQVLAELLREAEAMLVAQLMDGGAR